MNDPYHLQEKVHVSGNYLNTQYLKNFNISISKCPSLTLADNDIKLLYAFFSCYIKYFLGKENENATNKTQLYLDYKFALEMENQELKKELEINDDILLVDSLEVYRNIPMKMLLFYQW